MTVEEHQDDLASSWHKYMGRFYYEELRRSLEGAFKKAEDEGLSDLSCIVIKVLIELDFSHLINFNRKQEFYCVILTKCFALLAEFYDYFNTASPEELKGLIRESSVPLLQEMMNSVNEEVQIDKRQVSIELFMKNLPCTPDVLIGSGDFYQLAIPKLCTENLDLKGSWDSRPVLLTGKIVSLSQSFYLSDIKTFSCTNPRCRNSSRVIRHVGFDHLEQTQELGSEQLKPEVFVSGASNKKSTLPVVKCHHCREEISELYPFRSNLEFKLAKLKIEGSLHTVNVLLCGSKTCSLVKLSTVVSLIGFPKLTSEVPLQLKQIINSKLSSFYFEVYGVEHETVRSSISIKDTLELLVTFTSEWLRFPLLLLLCQLIGSANSIKLDLCLLGIDERIMNRIACLFNTLFKSTVIGNVTTPSAKSKKTKDGQDAQNESLPYNINITTANIKDQDRSLVYTKFAHDQVITVPIELSLDEEAEILLNTKYNHAQFDPQIPRLNTVIQLSSAAVKRIHSHFLYLRKQLLGHIPFQFTLDLLTKLTQISAAASNRTEAFEEDADFAVMLHERIISSYQYEEHPVDDYQMISPSVSFDFDGDAVQQNDNPTTTNLAEFYGL